MTTLDIAWLAGLIEGEGSFSYQEHRTRRHPRIMFDTVDRDVAEHFARLLGGTVYTRRGCGINSKTHKQQVYAVRIGGVTAVGVMMTIYPLMGVRRRAKIRECLAIWRTRQDRFKKGWDGHREKWGCQCNTHWYRAGCPALKGSGRLF